MSEEASAADPQGKNFRSSYYDSLVFRGEEKNIGCLETLLKADSIDVEGLKRFCQKHTLPPYHRLQVWNIILGVVPPYNDEETCGYVRSQREQQFCDLRRAVLVCLTTPLPHLPPHISETVTEDGGLTEEQLVLMHLLQENRLPTASSVAQARQEHQDWLPLARAFLDLCEEAREAYWLFTRFVKILDTVDQKLLEACCFQHLEKEDSALCAHVKSLADGIPFTLWFNQCFATTLPEYCLESVWDRLIGGCVTILVFLAVAILLTFKRRLLGARTPAIVTETLTQIPEENCILIVMKAVELWEGCGSPLLPAAHTHTLTSSQH